MACLVSGLVCFSSSASCNSAAFSLPETLFLVLEMVADRFRSVSGLTWSDGFRGFGTRVKHIGYGYTTDSMIVGIQVNVHPPPPQHAYTPRFAQTHAHLFNTCPPVGSCRSCPPSWLLVPVSASFSCALIRRLTRRVAARTSTPDGGRSSGEVRTDRRLTLEGVNGVVGLVGGRTGINCLDRSGRATTEVGTKLTNGMITGQTSLSQLIFKLARIFLTTAEVGFRSEVT